MRTRTRLLIVEDDPVIAADTAAMLAELGHAVCGVASDAARGIALAELELPDLALVDIRLGRGPDGITVAQALNERGIPFVFITAHTDPATVQRVAVTRPEGFLIKPFDRDDLRTQLAVVLARLDRTRPDEDGDGCLLLRDRGRWCRVPMDQIRYAEADDNYTILHTTTRRFSLVSTVSALEERVGATHLLRVHRSFAVNPAHITSFDAMHLRMDEVSIPIGRTYRAAVMRRLRPLH